MTTQTEPPNDGTAHLSRRVFLKTTGAAAGAAAAGAGTTGLAAADDNGDGLLFNPNSPTLPGLSAASTISDWIGDTGGTDATEVALHQTAISQQQDLDLIEVMMDNNLEDMSTMASIEARTAIASAWEDGSDAESASGDAIDAIYDYYSFREINVIEAAMKAMIEFSHIVFTAREHDDLEDEFVGPAVPSDYSGDAEAETWTIEDYDGAEDDPEESFPTTSFELVNDETHETICPELRFEWDNGDSWTGPINDEWIDGWTDETSNVISEIELTTEDGETVTDPFNIGVVNVPDADLQSERVFDPAETFARLVNEIHEQASEVAGNYDLDFVDQLYSALDDGTISPDEVRGVEGTARHLSGSDDVTEARFQLGLMTQLGMEQADLSSTASMAADWSGFTARDVKRADDGTRSLFPADHVENESYEGLLFAREVPGLATGGRYAVDPIVFASGTTDDFAVTAYDSSLNEQWSEVYHSSVTSAAVPSPDRETLFTFGMGGDVHAIDSTTGEIDWTQDTGETIENGEVTSDGSFVLAGTTDNVAHVIDADSGDLVDSYDHPDTVNSISSSPYHDLVVSGDSSGNIHFWDPETLETEWTHETELSSNVDALDLSRSLVAAGDTNGNVVFLDASSGEVNTTVSTEMTDGIGIAPDESVVYVSDMETLLAVDPETGDTNWSDDDHTGTITDIQTDPSGSRIYSASDEIRMLTPDGEELQVSEVENDPYTLEMVSPKDIDGTVHGGIFYDAGAESADDDEDAEEIYLSDGILEITAMSDMDGEEISPIGEGLEDELDGLDDRDLSEVFDEIDELDSFDDVGDLGDLALVVEELADADSVGELENVETQGWSEPEYDSYDVEDYATYIEKVNEEYTEALSDHGDPDDGFSWPWTGDDSLGDRQMLAAGAGIVAVLAGLAHSLSEGDDRDYRR